MLRFPIVCLTLLVLLASALHAADPLKSLSPRYGHWLVDEVSYIISSEERTEFLQLKSDPERDNFIRAFWNIRNPGNNPDYNAYKEEHYRRLAYANEHFGSTELQNGWRSDQGRVYITLGAPQQIVTYPNSRNVRPIIIWFYQAPSAAFPTHFNVLFYKRSAGDPYTLYSPYQDGPSRLTTGLEDLNVQQKSLQTIRKSLGDEVARTTLSLVPTEPVDLNAYSPSMTSDVLLATIKGYADNNVTREQLRARRSQEVVSARILMAPTQAEIQPATFREADGRQTTSYLFIPHEPMRNLIGTRPDGALGYSLTLQTTVFTRSGTRAYGTETGLQGTMSEDQAKAAREKRFAVEERLPLAPGEYKITATLTNQLSHIALQESQNLIVPDLSQDPWSISNLLVFSQRSSVLASDKVPFAIAHVRFAPIAVTDAPLHPTDPLWIAFQLWTRPATAKPSVPAELTPRRARITYSYGNLQGGQPPVTETEEVDLSNLDSSGNLLTGHLFDTSKLEPGAYRLVVTAVDQATQRKAFASTSFHIAPWTEPTALWTAFFTGAGGNRSEATDDYKRALTTLAQSQNDQAVAWLKRSLSEDQTFTPALDRLVDVLSRSHRFAEVAAIAQDHPPTHDSKEQTAILMAEASSETGHPDAGTRILEMELQFQPPSSALYLALSRMYQAGGDPSKAADFKHRAEALKN